MKSLLKILVVCGALVASSANAALITFVNKTTNDGVYTLSAAQASALGVTGADRIAFLRLRESNGVNWSVGDYFDINTVLNSTGDDAKILGIFNGLNSSLNYVGGDLEQFISAIVVNDLSGFYEGIAFVFDSSAGAIVFNGTSSFNGAQTRGQADFIQVSEPALISLLMAAFAFVTRRKIAHR